MPDFKVFLSLPSFSPLSLLVALCSANFRLSKSLVIGDVFEAKVGFVDNPLLNETFFLILVGLD